MNYQQTMILGRLAHTPELKALPSGTKIASFSLASNRVYKKDDQKVEETEWHNCVAFGKTAEILAQYAEGGQVLFVIGRNKTRSGEDKNGGSKRYATEVIVDEFQFGPKSQARAERKENEKHAGGPDNQEVTGKGMDLDTIEYPEEDINPDDIPF